MGQASEKQKEEGIVAGKGESEVDERVQRLKRTPRKMRTWFMQLSFWKKIIIIFTLNTLILLVLTDAIMLVLFGKISDDIIAISNQEKDAFDQIANTQIVSSAGKMALSRMDLYASYLNQLASVYYYFSSNPNLYTSLETADPPFPKPPSAFPNATYTQPAAFSLTSNSTFIPLPYIDQLLGRMIQTPTDLKAIKRLNVYAVNTNNTDDLTARTVPATDTFTIPSLTAITNRFTGIPIGSFLVSTPYTDSLTLNSTKDSLLALRTVLNSSTPGLNLYLQIEMMLDVVMGSLQNIYYFPSATILIAQKQDSGYTFYTTADAALTALVDQYYPIGTSRIAMGGQQYVTASVGLSNLYTLGQASSISNNTNDPVRCMLVVKASETERPAIEIQSFLGNQASVLRGIIFSWSFIILLSTVALATVVGNYIFSNLKMLSTKMEQYIKDPSKFHLIVIELKELELKGILKKLSDNLIGIIEKIEVRKRQRKDRINQNYHPLSVGQPKFQERQQLNDYEIIEQIKQEVKAKVEELKKEAAEKERIQKQKSQRQRMEKEKAERQKQRMERERERTERERQRTDKQRERAERRQSRASEMQQSQQSDKKQK